MQGHKIDRVLFFTAAIIVLVACIPLGLMPERAGAVVSELYTWISSNLGVFYQWFGIGTIVYLAWLSIGPYGNIRLGGGEGERPDFSTFSWAGMLFCAGTQMRHVLDVEGIGDRNRWQRIKHQAVMPQ